MMGRLSQSSDATGPGLMKQTAASETMAVADSLVIGGGPAGLSAALSLARFDRSILLFDAGQGRSTWHQVNHNYLGFPGGISARRLRELGREQLGEYPHVRCLEHKIETLERAPDGDGFLASGQAGEWRARAVVIATGVIDHYPHFDGWDEHVGRSMFWCIACDGYACKNERVVVVGHTNEAAEETLQLRRFTHKLTMLTNSQECDIDSEFQQRLEQARIPLIHDKIDSVTGQGGFFHHLTTKEGRIIELDQLFAVQGQTPQSDLARQLGVDLSESGYITVDTEQKTSVPGVFAAGDVTRLHSHQVSTAAHEGAQAAAAANYYLYPPEMRGA
jgi:thioredoxin reductase (NADPH)